MCNQILPRGRIPQSGVVLFTLELSDLDNQTKPSKGECFMKMPSAISTWCMILYFLWVGLAHFVAPLMASPFDAIGALLAIAAAVFLFLGR